MEFSKILKKVDFKKGYFMPKWGSVQLLCKKFKTGFHFTSQTTKGNPYIT